MGSERCPRCRVRFLNGITDEQLAQLDQAEHQTSGEQLDAIDPKSLPVVHFDAKTGVMNFLENDEGEADFVLECNHCGTVVQLNVSRCPICGTPLEVGDTGIVSLFVDMDFNGEPMPEADCPFCGEHVVLESGVCPSCKSAVEGDEQPGVGLSKVSPLVHAENIVFLHLDVETGDLNYLQRLANRIASDHMSVALEGIGNGSFEGEWSGLQRI
jgi:rubrerythrin